jgi:tripartite-type tricarboxylate transporter receptor subunit TctC
MVASLAASALEPRHQSPAEFAAVLKQDYDRWAEIAKATGFTMTE